jgi:hypothetical protein
MYVPGFESGTFILITVQRDATQSSLFIFLHVRSTCFRCQPHPSSGVHKAVTTEWTCRVISRLFCGASHWTIINPLMPNDHYSGRTAPLTSKRCILYIYSTDVGTAYFKHDIYSPFFFSSKCNLFCNSYLFGSCIIHILYTCVLKLKKIIPVPKG